MKGVVTRKIDDVLYAVEVPLTIEDAPERWTKEQIDAAFNRGIREMFGSTLASMAKSGKSQEEIQTFFDEEWFPNMSTRSAKLPPSEKAFRKLEKDMEGMTTEEVEQEINSIMERLKALKSN